jgi:23S rRNA pseudouridine2605 synthase
VPSPTEPPPPPGAVRLNRYLAMCAVAPRRKADVLIASGRVTVNGIPAPPGGLLVVAGRDRVEVDGREVVPPAAHRYFAVNKPPGVLSAVSDPRGRPVVVSLVPDPEARAGLSPVGRLDLDSRGLVLLTDDGELSFRLQHPRHHVEREYEVEVRGRPGKEALEKVRAGVELEEGRTGSAEVEVIDGDEGDVGRTRLRVVIRQGWKRQLRRTFAAVGHKVVDLMRVRIGTLRLGNLAEGGCRALEPEEVAALRAAVGLP